MVKFREKINNKYLGKNFFDPKLYLGNMLTVGISGLKGQNDRSGYEQLKKLTSIGDWRIPLLTIIIQKGVTASDRDPGRDWLL